MAVTLAAVLIGWGTLSLWAISLYGDYREAQLRGQVATLAASSANAVANALGQRLALVRGLAAFVTVKAEENTPGEIEKEFPAFATAYAQQVPGIRNISVAPDFVVRLVYPADSGNLKVIGNNILEDKRPGFAAVVKRAVETRTMAVHEPVELIQGGLGLLTRQAIFVQDQPWGAVGMVFMIPNLLEGSRITLPTGYAWAVRTGRGTAVGGDQEVFKRSPAMARIDLPDGSWELAVAPPALWRDTAESGPEMAGLRVVLGVCGALLVWLVWDLRRRRDRLELLVESRTIQLSDANAELERFAFVVAHDLQEPLRSIITFSQLVERGVGETLDDEHHQWLNQLMTAARRMRSLLHDVQIYLGESSIPAPRHVTAVNDALATCRRKLSAQIEAQGATISAGPLPHVWADHHRLTEILCALVSNAMEYASPERPPVITLTARRDGAFDVIEVEDNGVGIDSAYFDRIFQVFQRLHAQSERLGTGMGLSIAKKMMDRLGGRITLRSTPGQGSIFSLYFPLSGNDGRR